MHFTLHSFYTTLSIKNHRLDIPLVGFNHKARFLDTCRYSPDPRDTINYIYFSFICDQDRSHKDCRLVVIIICVLFLAVSSKSSQKRKKIRKKGS